MSRQFWTEALAWATTSGTAVANTTTETILFPNVTIPANYLQDGRTVRLIAFGQYSTTATPTILFTLRYGGVSGTIICKTAATTLPTITAGGWMHQIYLTTRSNGSAATLMGNGIAHVFAGVAATVAASTGAAADTPFMNGGVLTPAVATVDATADTALSLTATWSAASASNTTTGLNYTLEALN